MALAANLQRDQKKRAKPFTAEEFMPTWARPAPKSPAQMLATAQTITLALGGTVERSPVV